MKSLLIGGLLALACGEPGPTPAPSKLAPTPELPTLTESAQVTEPEPTEQPFLVTPAAQNLFDEAADIIFQGTGIELTSTPTDSAVCKPETHCVELADSWAETAFADSASPTAIGHTRGARDGSWGWVIILRYAPKSGRPATPRDLAHELGHYLQRSGAHNPNSGLMSAHTPGEIGAWELLYFCEFHQCVLADDL